MFLIVLVIMHGLFLWKIKILDESNRKTKENIGRQRQWILKKINEIIAGKNVIKMYSIHKEGKSVVTERFIRTLNNKIYKYMTLI